MTGQIQADWYSGPGVWQDADNWDNGVVPNNSAPDFYHVSIDSNAGVLSVVEILAFDQFIVDRLTLDPIDELILEGNSSLQIEQDVSRPMSGIIANSGSIYLSSDLGAGLTQLRIENDATLFGGGTISLSGPNALITDIFSTPLGHLTNEDNVIQGTGKLGDGRMQLSNHGMGLIHANVDGAKLTVRSRDDFLNQGTVQASDGGILELAGNGGAVIDNTAGTIQAFSEASVDLIDAVSISGGLLNGIATGKIRVPSSNTVTIADATIDNVHVENNTNLNLNGIISIGSLFINDTAAGGFARVITDGETTFTGNGIVTMNGSDAKLGGFGTNNGHLINTNNTIAGQGEIGSQAQLTNLAEGVIEANVDGGILQIKTRNGVDLINDGVMRATNGGTLRISAFSDGIFDNANGQIVADDNSCVDFQSNNLIIIGGDLVANGSGIFRTNEFVTVRLQDLNLAAPFQIDDNANLSLIGTIHNSEIHINGQTAASSNLVINSDVTLDGADVINMNGPGAQILTHAGDANNGRLTNVNNLIRGQGALGGNRLRLTNQAGGVIDADVAGQTLTVHTVSGDDLFNQGLIQASNGGMLQLNGFGGGGEMFNAGGTIQALDNSIVSLQIGPVINGGSLVSIGTGEIRIPQFESASLNDVMIEGQIRNSGNLIFRGPVENNAEIDLEIGPALIQIAANDPVVVSGSGTINLGIADNRLLGATGNNGWTMSAGTLTGIGQIQVASRFRGNATVAPGNSIGTLAFNTGHVHQFVDGATIEIEMNSTLGTPGVEWDFIEFANNGTLDFDDDLLPSGVTIKLVTLNTNGEPGPLVGFDPDAEFSIDIARGGTITGFNTSDFTVDLSGFANATTGTFCAAVEDSTLDTLRINYFPLLLGDLNGDCQVNLLDVAPFVDAITTGTFVPQGDINKDGVVDLLDIAPFVALLTD